MTSLAENAYIEVLVFLFQFFIVGPKISSNEWLHGSWQPKKVQSSTIMLTKMFDRLVDEEQVQCMLKVTKN